MTIGFKDFDDEDIGDLIQVTEMLQGDDKKMIISIEKLEKETRKILLAIEDFKATKEKVNTPRHNLMRARILVHLMRLKIISSEVFP